MNMPYLISRSCRWGIWRGTARHKTVSSDYEFNSFQQLQGIVLAIKNSVISYILVVPNFLLVTLFFFCGKFSKTTLFQTSVWTTMAVQRDENQKGPENTIKRFHLTQFSIVLGAVLTVVHEFTKTTENTFVSWNKAEMKLNEKLTEICLLRYWNY